MKYDIDIFHYINIYKREWRKMFYLICVAMVISTVMARMQPLTYKSTAIVLSPEQSNTAGNIGKYFGIPNLAMGSSSNDLIFSILKSRRMSNDINEHFNLRNKRKFWWGLDTYVVTGGFAVEVTGSDPDLIRDIANFAIENLDKINIELQVTSQKPMVKVLDTALRGTPTNKNVSKKAITAGLFVFLIHTLFIFFREYLSQIKASRNK